MLLISEFREIAIPSVQPNYAVASLLNSLEKVTGIPKTTIFTVFTSLLVFCLGVLTNYIINLLKERSQRINYKNTISLLLETLGQDCKKQHENLNSMLGKTSILTGKSIGIQIQVLSPLFFLNKMDYSLFIKHYVKGCNKKLKTKAAIKVFQIIGYTNVFESDTDEKVKHFFSMINPLQDAYLKNIAIIEKFEHDLLTLEVKDYDFKTEAKALFRSWKEKNTNNNFKNSFSNLVSPFQKLLDRYSLEACTSVLIDALEICHRTYSDMAHFDRLLYDLIENLSIANKRVYRQVNIILKIFQYRRSN